MSYGMTAALQEAVYQRLAGDAGLTALVGAAIYDQPPAVAALPETYITLGHEVARDRGDATAGAAVHDFGVTVISAAAGFQRAKQAAAVISDALTGPDLVLTRGRVVYLRFLKARARRIGGGARRRIDLTFRALVEGD